MEDALQTKVTAETWAKKMVQRWVKQRDKLKKESEQKAAEQYFAPSANDIGRNGYVSNPKRVSDYKAFWRKIGGSCCACVRVCVGAMGAGAVCAGVYASRMGLQAAATQLPNTRAGLAPEPSDLPRNGSIHLHGPSARTTVLLTQQTS